MITGNEKLLLILRVLGAATSRYYLKKTVSKVYYYSKHESIIRTGITCKKIPCYMRDSACRWFIVENAKIFRSYVKNF